MSFLIYSLSAVIAFSGVIAGAVLALNTREEMPTASKYLPLMQSIIFATSVAVFLNYFKLNIAVRILVYAAVIFVLLKKQRLNFYPALAALFFSLGQSSQGLFTISALVFLYGLPAGSLCVIHNKRMKWPEAVWKVSKKHGAFLLAAILLQLLYAVFVLKTRLI
ncbi:hypothetical protein J4470_03725 [Candidatus Woesearchaeota archaeon]|nr:hypothetical protein [Candidatus Woesearchaeota archaeon]